MLILVHLKVYYFPGATTLDHLNIECCRLRRYAGRHEVRMGHSDHLSGPQGIEADRGAKAVCKSSCIRNYKFSLVVSVVRVFCIKEIIVKIN